MEEAGANLDAAAEDAAAEAEAETTEMEANIENESMNEAAAD
jgi:hypothetical protein